MKSELHPCVYIMTNKGGSRQKKINLINSKNPEWKDLYEEFFA